MLSPNARNEVAVNLGGSRTVTTNEQVSVRCRRVGRRGSVTVFCPIVNGDPGKGVQFVTTGALPFAIVGEANVTGGRDPVDRLHGLGRRARDLRWIGRRR